MIDREALSSELAARALVERIEALVTEPVSLMEVCGTHTVAISRFGLRSMLPPDLRLLSGPGCPVCVTPLIEIDRAIAVARTPGVIVTTFGDMMRVPGSKSSLETERAEGADVRILYGPLEALEIAEAEPASEVVFLGVGFETTSPTIAATVVAADRRGITNFSVLPFFKTVPAALDMLAALPGRALDGFICPGHVSAIIGADAYEPVARDRNMPCVVIGFEPLDSTIQRKLFHRTRCDHIWKKHTVSGWPVLRLRFGQTNPDHFGRRIVEHHEFPITVSYDNAFFHTVENRLEDLQLVRKRIL